MTDVAHVYNGDILAADFTLDGADLAAEDGLATAVIISLFTDRRAETDDELPAGQGDSSRGWWGDAVAPTVAGTEIAGDRIGSRLWLLSREKQTPEVLARAKEYAQEALQWLIDDGIAERVDVETGIVRTGVLGIGVVIHRPGGGAVDYRFDHLWEGTG